MLMIMNDKDSITQRLDLGRASCNMHALWDDFISEFTTCVVSARYACTHTKQYSVCVSGSPAD